MFQSDFLNETMLEVMSPQELYFYRLTSKWIYNYMTMDKIKNKIYKNIHQRLQYILKDDYQYILNIINQRQMTLSGPFITECIYEKYHDDTLIELICYEQYMGNDKQNVFIDFKFSDPLTIFKNLVGYFRWEMLSNYQINKYHISLDVCVDEYNKNCDEFSDESNEYYPKLFRCELKNNQLTCVYLKNIMHKKIVMNDTDEYFGFYSQNHFYYERENIKLTKKLCQLYDIQLIDNLPRDYKMPLHYMAPIPDYLLNVLK